MTVLICCGGTAGHIFPGLALVEELKEEKEVKKIILVVSSGRRDREFLNKTKEDTLKNVKIETISTKALPYHFSFQYIPFVLKLLPGLLKSFILLIKYRPQVAVGFGGYVSFSPLVIAHFLGIPTIIHEQNLHPGRANRFLARIADKVTVSFEETGKFFASVNFSNKIVKTGLPIRKDILKQNSSAKEKVYPALNKKKPDKFTVFIFGGSQGAHYINRLVLEWLGQIDKMKLNRLRLIHVTGKKDFQWVKQRYRVLSVDSFVLDFLRDMTAAYKTADLLIGRSGASTIFEAAVFGLPCILIPYPYATGHQKENAAYLERNGCAVILNEGNFSARDLEKAIRKLSTEPELRQDLSQKIRMLNTPNASCKLKEQVFSLCRS